MSSVKQTKQSRPFFQFLSTVTFLGVLGNFKTFATLGVGVLKFGWLLPTVGSMLLSVILYAQLYGWGISVVLVLLLLIHELGHYAWMKAYKLDPKAPMFVPFLGAFVAMEKMPANEATHAWVALAGPLVGGVSSLLLYFLAKQFAQPMLVAAAVGGLILNLLQLVPAKPLDGGFVIGAISKWLLVPGMIGLFILAANLHSVLLFLIGIVGLAGFSKKSISKHMGKTVLEYEKEFVQADSSDTATSGSASLAQKVQIGAAYLGLTVGLALAIAWASLELGFSDKALASTQVKVLSAALARVDNANLRFMRSQAYAANGQLENAIADSKRAMELGKKDSAAYYNDGKLMMLTGKTDQKVVDAFLSAAQLAAPESMDERNSAFAILYCGDYKNALKAADRLPASNDIKAEVFERTDKIDQARQCYNDAVKNNPDFYWGTRCRRALFFISENDLPAAKADIDKALEIDADEALPHLVQGWYFFKSGDLDKSWTAAEKSLGLAKDLKDSTTLDRPCLLSACHRLRYEISKKHIASSADALEKGKWNDTAGKELALYQASRDWGTLYIPRGLK